MSSELPIVCAWLSISSWVGISADAEHYYGKIRFSVPKNTESIELKKSLSQKETIHLNKKDGCYEFHRYKPGDEINRFETEEDLIANGINLFKEKYPDGILFKGDGCSLSAQLLFYWPKSLDKLAKKVNKLATEWEEIDGYEGNYSRAEEIDDLWYKLVKPYIYPNEQ